MSTQPLSISPIRNAWYKWKALRLPWRKRFFVGHDLHQNTYWEFRDALTSTRLRRIVQTPPSTHYSDVKLTPQWHQWLRHTRDDAPSIEELLGDVQRRERLRVLARMADERWEAKGRYVEVSGMRGERKALERGVGVRESGQGYEEGVQTQVQGQSPAQSEKEKQDAAHAETSARGEIRHEEVVETQLKEEKKYKEDPWKKARGGPSEEWQPKAWDPNDVPVARR